MTIVLKIDRKMIKFITFWLAVPQFDGFTYYFVPVWIQSYYNCLLIMKKKQSNGRQSQDPGYYDAVNNSSAQVLNYGRPQNMMYSPQKSQEEQYVEYQKREVKRAKKQGLDHLYKEDYQPARYSKAVEFRNARSYLKKLPSGHYKELDLFVDTEELKYFGLGAYFYVEFFRRMTWLFFIMAIFQGITIYINWLGSGMSAYSSSFSTYLIKSTLGNYTANNLSQYDAYIETIVPATNYLVMFIFYLVWKGHFFSCITDQEEDNSDVKPEKFCLEIEGLEETYINEEELQRFFSSFGPVYEISLVRRYKNKLSYFEELDELQEEIKEEQLEIILGSGDKEHVGSLRKEKEKLNKYISTLQIFPKTISAFVHFQYEKSKIDCLTYFNKHYLFDTCSHNCMRTTCCCCVDEPEAKYLFRGQKLLIKSDKVPTPEDINWSSFEINFCSKFFRVFFSFLIIVIFLAISCAIIGLCSIYISSHSSNCEGVTIPSTAALANATANSTIIKCYCDANLFSSFSDSTVKSVCQSYLTDIYVSQGIQYAVIFTSSITNFLFGFIVDKLVNCVRPASKSSGMMTKTMIYTVFLVLNSLFIPVLIYADIFGFQPSNYVSFLTIISTSLKNFLLVSNLTLYPDFTQVWYRNVSPIFVNFLIVNTITVWVFFIIDKYLSSKTSLEDDEGKILQKHMNESITSYKLDVYKESANLYLIIIMISMFYTGIPVLLPLGFFNIFSRYIVNRSLLQNNSSRIEGLGEEFSSLTLSIFPFILILFPLFGERMLVANSSIYPSALSITLPVLGGYFNELDKQIYLPFFILISMIAFFEFFLYNTLIRCCSWMCSLCYQKKDVTHPYHTRPFNEYAKGMNILCSYNIRNNDEWRNAILNLEKYLIDKEEM